MRIALLPVGTVNSEMLRQVADELGFRGVETAVLPPKPVPDAAFLRAKGQYDADAFVALAAAEDGDKVVSVTDVDLGTPGLNFVFGKANIGGKAAVVSVHRLAYGNPAVLLDRLVKEVRHELGHTFGLLHCENPSCVMHFSNSLQDTDVKGRAFCGRCQGLLPYRGDFRRKPR